MATVRPLHRDDWETLRDLRLRALRDSPTAFASSVDKEQVKPPSEWQEWAAGSSRTVNIVAWERDKPSGLVACVLEEDPPTQLELVSMWVDPAHRGRGIGKELVDAVLQWGEGLGAETIHLWVTETNEYSSSPSTTSHAWSAS